MCNEVYAPLCVHAIGDFSLGYLRHSDILLVGTLNETNNESQILRMRH